MHTTKRVNIRVQTAEQRERKGGRKEGNAGGSDSSHQPQTPTQPP